MAAFLTSHTLQPLNRGVNEVASETFATASFSAISHFALIHHPGKNMWKIFIGLGSDVSTSSMGNLDAWVLRKL